MSGVFFNERAWFGYTPSAGSANTNALVWNEVLSAWESVDVMPANVTCEFMSVWYDSTKNGSGQRLIMLSSDGRLYAHDEAAGDTGGSTISATIKSKDYVADKNIKATVLLDEVEMQADAGANISATLTRTYRAPSSIYTTSLDFSTSAAINNGGRLTDDGKTHAVTSAPADSDGERAMAVNLAVNYIAPGGSRIFSVLANVTQAGTQGAVQG